MYTIRIKAVVIRTYLLTPVITQVDIIVMCTHQVMRLTTQTAGDLQP